MQNFKWKKHKKSLIFQRTWNLNINEFEKEKNKIIRIFLKYKTSDIFKQLKILKKMNKFFNWWFGSTISEIISSCTALRILYKKLKESL